jgi:site-specific DNA recombinase
MAAQAVAEFRLAILKQYRGETLDAIGHDVERDAPQRHLLERARQIADELGSQPPERIQAIVTALIRRVEIRPNSLQIDVGRSRFSALLAARSIDLPVRDDKPGGSDDDILTLTSPARLRRVGREMKMLVDGHPGPPPIQAC